MMANAARDPYWQASVRAEVLNLPQYDEVIEDKCATCHMPMARFTAAADGAQGSVLDNGFNDPNNPLHALAFDGVSCTLCHQIQNVGLGQPDSFSGGFVIDTGLPTGERPIFSQFEVAPDLANLMKGASGFVPEQGPQVSQAELCATCHTLYTPYVDANGQIVGTFPEQMAYVEWQHSALSPATPCQSCHMPQADGAVVTSVTGGPPRSPFAKHVFVGGNAYVISLFRNFGEDMAVTADSATFDATHQRVLDLLQQRAAVVSLGEVAMADSHLTASVVVENRAGHKFPTGFPSRRAWLHVTVTDGSGKVIFESGAVTADGKIIGDDHDADPTRFEAHYTVIASPDDVQVYESVMMDTEGNVTTTLLRGSGYLKNNRLLPAGFDKQTAAEDIAVDALALQDPDFVGGSDTVVYSVDVGDTQGPFTVGVELLFQSISYRWAERLRAYDSAETASFLNYYDSVPNVPEVVSSATATTSE
jgi:hypothetical protein